MRFSLLVVAAIASLAAALPQKSDPSIPKQCTPGSYVCKDNTDILVCAQSRSYVLSATCNPGCCRQTGGGARCYC